MKIWGWKRLSCLTSGVAMPRKMQEFSLVSWKNEAGPALRETTVPNAGLGFLPMSRLRPSKERC